MNEVYTMGMFSTILVPCPGCGEKAHFQTKSGGCDFGCYELAEAPANELLDVNRHSPHKCDKCGVWFEVDLRVDHVVMSREVVKVDPPCWCHFPIRGRSCPAHADRGES
ncbi:MAG: hypothetical protein HC814_08405 [Rhodobacteraceae bacterium]|nr:hypothetical protein [Paracoccaceae bacterium]